MRKLKLLLESVTKFEMLRATRKKKLIGKTINYIHKAVHAICLAICKKKKTNCKIIQLPGHWCRVYSRNEQHTNSQD